MSGERVSGAASPGSREPGPKSWAAEGEHEVVDVEVDADGSISLQGTYGHGRRSYHWMTPEQALELALVLLRAGHHARSVRGDRQYMEGMGPGGTCGCGMPDPGVRSEGGCWCSENAGANETRGLALANPDAVPVVVPTTGEGDDDGGR